MGIALYIQVFKGGKGIALEGRIPRDVEAAYDQVTVFTLHLETYSPFFKKSSITNEQVSS